MRRTLYAIVGTVAFGLTLAAPASLAQRPDLAVGVRRFVTVDSPVVALTHVKLIDGTGAAALDDQTIVLQDGRIAAVGPSGEVAIPAGADVHDLTGHTVMPGMIGLHDHLFYTAGGGRRVQLSFSAPRLYLGSGVTTIRTTGSSAPYQDINLRQAVNEGDAIGPRIHLTAPYITGGTGPTQMALINSPEQARRFVAYWGEEGATWIKAYTNISRENLGAAIEEAHARGMKVTGHLCSVSFREAVALGIDNLEHGLATASDFSADKQPDECPSGTIVTSTQIDVHGELAQDVIRTMVENDVSMTSTLAVYELFFPNRPTQDERSLEAMAPEVRERYLQDRKHIDSNEEWPLTEEMLHTAMAFERAFVAAGGTLAAGVDPTGNGGALPGLGDQRNYELLIEAGFAPEQVVQILTHNGAKILGVEDAVGTVEVGRLADLAVMEGDLTQDPTVIRNMRIVFKDGYGYDSAALIESVRGQVGIR